MIATILSWVAMPIIRYGLIAVAGLLFTAFMRDNAARPWKNQVTELKETIVARERIIKSHEELVEANEAEAEKLKVEIEGIVNASKDHPGACVLSSAQLQQLRRLAGGG